MEEIKTEAIEKEGKKYKIISTTVSNDFYRIAKEKGIKWRDAMARGIRILSEGMSLELEIIKQKESIESINRKMIILGNENDLMKKELELAKKREANRQWEEEDSKQSAQDAAEDK